MFNDKYFKEFWNTSNNKEVYKKVGIDKFHKAGYWGERVNMSNYEKCNYNHPAFHGKVVDIFDNKNRDDLSRNWHGDKVNLIQHMVAPKANLYLIDRDLDDKEDKFVSKSYEIIKKHNISIFSTSIDFSVTNERKKVFDDLVNSYNFKAIVLAGNSGWNGINRPAPINSIQPGAIQMTSKGEMFTPSYTCKPRPTFFTNAICLTNTPSLRGNGKIHYEEGTSFSTPFLAGMVALVDDFFIDRVGRPLHYLEMQKFIDDNNIYVDTIDGVDNYLFILPNPCEIDVDRYIFVNNSHNSPNITENGEDSMKFKDVDKDRWYYKSIKNIVDKGIMRGYEDKTFRPGANITRSELAETINNLIKYLDK